jgi:hypothetical protein
MRILLVSKNQKSPFFTWPIIPAARSSPKKRMILPGQEMSRVSSPITQALTTTLRVIAKDVFAAATADRGQFVENRFLREI